MAGYRFVDPNPVIFNLLGLQSAPNGSLTFYEKGTTTPKATYSVQELTAGLENANPVDLDSSGRAETEIWLDGEYTVVAKAENGTTIWTRNVVPEIAPGLAIPDLAGVAGWYLSNDGTTLIWVQRLDLPDPSGSAGYSVVVNSDGTDYILQAPAEAPVIPDPEIVITTVAPKSVRVGVSDSTTKFLSKYGSDSVGPSGTKTVTKAIMFDAPFAINPWFVQIMVTSGAATASGAWPTWAITSLSTTGFTVTFNIPDDDDRSQWQIGNTINFNWKAEGTVVVA